ncbi:hypothetical protein [Aliterella atlantica]|uniref:Uncharacterized protein n=1 Tax=Aliterella atlantica CENA595 TaxID=1618023 RepID=A0A0D8ZPN8_9CYAN|nr:hypothetical protein [Aliterella atlantica]KJH70768.1 hypothetical protein UH38_16180 [Aliterella atlantica CENA595]
MKKQTEREIEQYRRLQEIFATGRQRYLRAGGDPYLSGGSLNNQDHLTDAEKQELIEIGRQLFDRNSAQVKS